MNTENIYKIQDIFETKFNSLKNAYYSYINMNIRESAKAAIHSAYTIMEINYKHQMKTGTLAEIEQFFINERQSLVTIQLLALISGV
jgi:hypothetical protein